jgi:hypothetical protein
MFIEACLGGYGTGLIVLVLYRRSMGMARTVRYRYLYVAYWQPVKQLLPKTIVSVFTFSFYILKQSVPLKPSQP